MAELHEVLKQNRDTYLSFSSPSKQIATYPPLLRGRSLQIIPDPLGLDMRRIEPLLKHSLGCMEFDLDLELESSEQKRYNLESKKIAEYNLSALISKINRIMEYYKQARSAASGAELDDYLNEAEENYQEFMRLIDSRISKILKKSVQIVTHDPFGIRLNRIKCLLNRRLEINKSLTNLIKRKKELQDQKSEGKIFEDQEGDALEMMLAQPLASISLKEFDMKPAENIEDDGPCVAMQDQKSLCTADEEILKAHDVLKSQKDTINDLMKTDYENNLKKLVRELDLIQEAYSNAREAVSEDEIEQNITKAEESRKRLEREFAINDIFICS